MSSRSLRFFLASIMITLSLFSKAQEGEVIKLISYRDEGRVLLRWAPNKASAWLELNKNGYTLERYTIIRDAKRVFPAEKLRILDSFKPASLQEWDNVAYDNKYAAIVAQAIFGDGFELQPDHLSGDIISSIQLSKEQDLRYSFTILASDQSFEVAQMAGLGFEDLNVNSNEAYMYKLYGNYGSVASDTTYTIVDINDVAPLPRIKVFGVEFEDSKAMLRWRADYYEEVYSSYIIEKSEDGVNYKPINDTPTITTSTEKPKISSWMLKSDTLISNDQKYYYRIRGKTPFGIIGPVSEVVDGIGKPALDISIGITKAEVEVFGIQLFWETSGMSGKDIHTYYIHRSANSIDYYLLDSLAGDQNQYIDQNPLASNYYKIKGFDKFGQKAWSLPYYVQAEDSIPPKVPVDIIGICDSTGRVKLRWSKNPEGDTKGYRVFRSRIKGADYRQITVDLATDTIFYDNVDLGTLSKKMYYKVLAVDNRGNKSVLSRESFVQLIDIIPPVPPRVTGYRLDKEKVEISWSNSSSSDAAKNRLYRVNKDSTELIKELSIVEDRLNYTDSTAKIGFFSYYLTAVDSIGNESAKSNTIRVKAREPSRVNDIKLVVKVDRKIGVINLKWEQESNEVLYRLYRAKDEDPISLYKVFTGDVNEFADGALEINSKYHYRLQVITQEGSNSILSDQIDIVF